MFRILLAALPEDERALWAVAAARALRCGEVQGFDSSNVDLARAVILPRREGASVPRAADVEADVGGAKALGLRAVLVRTGKFQAETLAAATVQPDAVVDSIVDVPAAPAAPEGAAAR